MEIHPRFIIERSANHIHLSLEDAQKIFNTAIPKVRDNLRELSIKGEYNTGIKLYSEDTMQTYTLLYPFREYSQIEVSMSDYYRKFKEYPKRVNSGELEGAKTVNVFGVDIPIIVTLPHVHFHNKKELYYYHEFEFPFYLTKKFNETIDGINRIHLDTDQFAAIQ
jgi:propanediol utilization protein